MQTLLGFKKEQSQRFLQNGKRIPVTFIDVKGNMVISKKTQEKDQYSAIQLGIGTRKSAGKALTGHIKGAKKEGAPKFLREVRVFDNTPPPEVGTVLNPSEVFQPGDIVNVTGTSKGKGFAGVVKRHGFHGGPKTHGQSDRHRAPGAIGQGTTPGRVYKGKRMAGRMGSDRVTIQNLEIVDITNDGVLVVKGLIPGITNGLIIVKKTGEDKKFVPLYKEPSKVSEKDNEVAGSSSVSGDVQSVLEEKPTDEQTSLSESQSTDPGESLKKDVGSTLDSPENGQTPAIQTASDSPKAGSDTVAEKTSSIGENKEEVKEESSDAKALDEKEDAS